MRFNSLAKGKIPKKVKQEGRNKTQTQMIKEVKADKIHESSKLKTLKYLY